MVFPFTAGSGCDVVVSRVQNVEESINYLVQEWAPRVLEFAIIRLV